MLNTSDIPHPGFRIRAEVLPPKMSVTKAAQLLGVGRPALSNLLNGNAALSPDMAARLEKAFNYPREGLMEMQARYDAAQAKHKDVPSDIRAYVPPYLAIKANELELWASHNIPARSRLAVFLRILVHSTGKALTKVDFPGNDDAERPGWDGFVEAGEGSPWVPVGCSGWEFGTNEDPKAKAEGDYDKSVRALEQKDRMNTTFVFVTPRRWPGKIVWQKTKHAQGLWKDVKAYDASDLEQWLEQSIPAQAWFANEAHIPAQNVRSLDKCWDDWANVTEPPLTGTLFSSAIDASKRIMVSLLSQPPAGPILIAADSSEEALAFLAQLLGPCGGEDLTTYRDRVLVFDTPGTLSRLAASRQTFIPVVFTREIERELAPYAKSMSSIVIYPRNAIMGEPHIVLEPASYETFTKSLKEMGKDRDEISRLAIDSGRSLTVLRRRLSTFPVMQIPRWAADHQKAASLVPFMLVGAWNSENQTDKEGLSLLAGDRPYEELEKEFQSLANLDDTPIWSIGVYRGVISKIDLLFAIAFALTPDDLKRYFSMASLVLGEDDPSLDLDEDKRWAASIYGKIREFSTAFREGISETLVLLAVHGHSFRSRLGVDTEAEAVKVVRDLLPAPLTTRVLEANDRDLPTYAEAAPNEFLSILERDLETDTPAVLGLLRPVSSGVFGSPSRTGLLWALEGLSWSPETLPRAALILARLAQVEINDNWVNKPTHSLGAIFRAWMPQTAANLQTRVGLIAKISEKFPDVAWKICISQIGTHNSVGGYSHKPRWRPDGYGFGEPLPTWGPILAFIRKMVEMVLTWKEYSLSMLSDLVEHLYDLTETDQDRVWSLIQGWANTKASDSDKATLREKIRVTTLSKRAAVRARHNGRASGLTTLGKAAYTALEPTDLLNKHEWLFREGWVEESADEIEDLENIDFHKRDEWIIKLRTEALREILVHHGLDGILEIARRGKAARVIGALASSAVLPEQDIPKLLHLALEPILNSKEEVHSNKNLIAGALHALTDNNQREPILRSVMECLPEEDMVRLLILAPYNKCTWKLVDAVGDSCRTKYWSEVTPEWIHNSDLENKESIESLLEAGRPRAAFYCVRYEPAKIDAPVLWRILSEIVQGGNDQPGDYMLDHYNVEQAFMRINSSTELSLDQKASLEFAYIGTLARPWDQLNAYGIPNLERYIELHPELFIQAVAWTYKRKDGAKDPVDIQVPPESIETMAGRGYELINAIKRIPGHNDLGELEAARLLKWIKTARESCAELSRIDAADNSIGKMLSYAPVGEDGIWPCEPVRDVIEDIQSVSIVNGMLSGVYNSRGVVFRGEGGDQERELATKYRKWSEVLQVSHPFVASRLLLELAKIYEHEASREDLEAGIRRRLY